MFVPGLSVVLQYRGTHRQRTSLSVYPSIQGDTQRTSRDSNPHNSLVARQESRRANRCTMRIVLGAGPIHTGSLLVEQIGKSGLMFNNKKSRK